MKSIEQIARAMWSAYSRQAGGKTFDGHPLPDWDHLEKNRQECWFAAAQAARDEIQEVL